MSTSEQAMRLLFDQQQHAVLSSGHSGLGGWPFGSVVPYAVLPGGDAVVFVSDIAEHTKNLQRDARASLFVADPAAAARPQAGARLTVLVRASLPPTDDVAAIESVYFARFPGASAMRQAHGFRVWRLAVDCVRWIAGFGEMGWIDRATWSGQADELAAHAAGIVEHMNEDHAGAVVELVAHVTGIEATKATITGVDRGGFSAVAVDRGGAEHVVRLPFLSVVTTPTLVREATVQLLRAARLPSG